MGVQGIIFIAVALFGAVVNFFSRRISARLSISELGIKVTALVIVAVSVILLFVFGK